MNYAARTEVLETWRVPHILLHIASYLDPASVKRACQVSSHWYDVLHSRHSRKVWKWVRLDVSLSTYPDQIDNIAVSRKVTITPEIRISDGTKSMVESVLDSISVRKFPLIKLDFHLSRIPFIIEAPLISRAFSKLNNCHVFSGQLEQLEPFVSAVSETENITIKALHIYGGEIVANLSPKKLKKSACKVKILLLEYPTSNQIGKIFTELASTEETNLRNFQIAGDNVERDLSHLSPGIVSAALLKLENTDELLEKIILSPGQINHLMMKIKDAANFNFTRMNFLPHNISRVPSDVLVGAVTRLESVLLADVTSAQLQALFTRIMYGGSKLNGFALHQVDLSTITPVVLLGALRMVRVVCFYTAVFTTDQITAIIAMVTRGDLGKLKSLTIPYPIVEAEAADMLQAVEGSDLLDIIL